MAGTWRFTAMFVSDIVDYSRLAGADEERSPVRLKALRSDNRPSRSTAAAPSSALPMAASACRPSAALRFGLASAGQRRSRRATTI
jgi:hypothetical protein